jgi:hypothetical protein
MKVKSVKAVGKMPVYDISVEDVSHYILENGIVTHNTAVTYAANQIFVISKAQEKDGDEIAGYKFTINIEKSRFVREKSKLPFTVLYESGIQKWSSLFDMALEQGSIVKANQGWYNTINLETGEVLEPKRRSKSIEEDDAFFESLIKNKDFIDFVENKFKMNAHTINSQEDSIIDIEDEMD